MKYKIKIIDDSLNKTSPIIKHAIELIIAEDLDPAILENSLSTFLSPQHLGTSFSIDLDNKKNHRITLFYLACYVKNATAIETLLKIHPNIVTQKTGGLNNPIQAIIEGLTKETEVESIECLTILFDLAPQIFENSYGKETVWTMLFDTFKVSSNFEAFYSYCFAQKPDCFSLYELFYIMKVHNLSLFQNYPLINDVMIYENKQLYYPQENNFIYNSKFLAEKSLNLESFFKHTSITKALEERYGIKSPRLNNFMCNKLFAKKKHIFELKYKELIKADFLKNIYLKKDQENFSDFLEILESESKILSIIPNLLNDSINTRNGLEELNKMSKLFTSIYTPSQIKNILLSEEGISKTSLSDIFGMYSDNTEEYSNYLKTIPFNQLDTLEKLHDHMSEAVEMMDQEFFELDQCTNYPLLNKINEILMPPDYGLKLANDSYELVRWGTSMGHCIGGGDYADDCRDGDCVILAITHKNEPKYAIEIRMNNHKGRLNQVQGKSRAEPPAEILVCVFRGLREIGIVPNNENYMVWKKR